MLDRTRDLKDHFWISQRTFRGTNSYRLNTRSCHTFSFGLILLCINCNILLLFFKDLSSSVSWQVDGDGLYSEFITCFNLVMLSSKHSAVLQIDMFCWLSFSASLSFPSEA